MTKEELDRIKKAYSSGLKVQIWFNGCWKDFDIRDYSMYSEPFSENRQYRIIGSDYADIAEKRIEELENKIADIKANCDFALEGRDIKIKELEQELTVEKDQHQEEINLHLHAEEYTKSLEQQIEKMKCCGNCKRLDKEYKRCELKLLSMNNCLCKDKDKWEME